MQKQEHTRGTPLRVFWVDSCHAPGWAYGTDYSMEPEAVVSLGFVVAAEDDGLILTTSLSRKGGILAPLIVPWESITHIQELPAEWGREQGLPI